MKPFQFDQDGVSNVVGAVLIFALIIAVLTTMQTTFVPVWEEEREAEHARQVLDDMARLRTQADQGLANGTPISSSLTLGSGSSSRFLTTSPTQGSLSFLPGTGSTGWSAPELRIIALNEVLVSATEESWVSYGAGDQVDNVGQIHHLRVRITAPGEQDDGDNLVISVTDANGDPAGRLQVIIDEHPSGFIIRTNVTSATGEVLFNQGESTFQQASDDIEFWWIDALAPELHFEDVLRSAAAPFNLTLDENGLAGEYTVTYTQQQVSGGQSVLVGNSGQLFLDYARSFTGGRLVYAAENNHHLQQTIAYEAGGIVVSQDDGAVVRFGPTLGFSTVGNRTGLDLSLPTFTGDPGSVSGRNAALVTLVPGSSNTVTGTAPSFAINQTTPHPEAWARHVRSLAEDAGLSDIDDHFTLTTGDGWFRFELLGASADPDEHDLAIHITHRPLRVSLQS